MSSACDGQLAVSHDEVPLCANGGAELRCRRPGFAVALACGYYHTAQYLAADMAAIELSESHGIVWCWWYLVFTCCPW